MTNWRDTNQLNSAIHTTITQLKKQLAGRDLRVIGLGDSLIAGFDPHTKEMFGLGDQIALLCRDAGINIQSIDLSLLGDNAWINTINMLDPKQPATLQGVHNFALYYPRINAWAKKAIPMGKTNSVADLKIAGLCRTEKWQSLLELLKPKTNTVDVALFGPPTARALDLLTKGKLRDIVQVFKPPGVVDDDIVDMVEVIEILSQINDRLLGVLLGLPKTIERAFKFFCHYSESDKRMFEARGGVVINHYPGVSHWPSIAQANIIHPDIVAQKAAVLAILQAISDNLDGSFLQKTGMSTHPTDALRLARQGRLVGQFILRMDKTHANDYEDEHLAKSGYWQHVFDVVRIMIAQISETDGREVAAREIQNLLLVWRHDRLVAIYRRSRRVCKLIAGFMREISNFN